MRGSICTVRPVIGIYAISTKGVASNGKSIEVQDGVKWETSFRTHGDLFKTYGLLGPVQFTASGNEVALSVDTADAQAFLKSINEPQTVEAMKVDGVKRETMKVYVLDKSAF
ncbi:MAG: hypothetical protein JO270_18075 [Acidobacteriaceae bacterium]|nr:hypothetical protein [Acidobacteriaceae bacterium]